MAVTSGSASAGPVQTRVQTVSGTSRISLPFNDLTRAGDGLENRCTGNRTGGSNPSSSDDKERKERLCQFQDVPAGL